MGLLVEGVWHDRWYDTKRTGGRFEREPTSFHGRVTADGSSGFPAETGRYHLYVALACPWAHRTLIVRRLKGLEDAISVSVVHYLMLENGWEFSEEYPDHVNGFDHLHQVYTRAKADYTGRVTVPVLWDKAAGTIVNNESAEIIRMLNTGFNAWSKAPELDLYPEELRSEIDAINDVVYRHVNNGVYRCGFATTQEAYEEAFGELFATLDELEARLARSRYLCGDRLTEADIRLFTTLVRFDPVYVGHFKCNKRRLVDHPNLFAFARELYQLPGVAETCNFEHIKRHYYMSHTSINPTQIVPLGPEIDFSAPHGRG